MPIGHWKQVTVRLHKPFSMVKGETHDVDVSVYNRHNLHGNQGTLLQVRTRYERTNQIILLD